MLSTYVAHTCAPLVHLWQSFSQGFWLTYATNISLRARQHSELGSPAAGNLDVLQGLVRGVREQCEAGSLWSWDLKTAEGSWESGLAASCSWPRNESQHWRGPVIYVLLRTLHFNHARYFCFQVLSSLSLHPLAVFSVCWLLFAWETISRHFQRLSRLWQNFCYWSFGGFLTLPA